MSARKNFIKVVEEKKGYKIGINTNPDVAQIPEEKRWMVEFPNGEHFVGNQSSIMRMFKKETQ